MQQWMREQNAIKDAIAEFPEEFGLRGYRGKRFKFSERDSYVTDGVVMLYTHVLRADGSWIAFVKGTVEEFRREVVR